MAAMRMVEYADASPEVRAVYDDIMTTRKVDAVNNFWKVIANDPAALKRTWESLKQVMQPGALDPLTKELIYIAVSVSNGASTASPPTRPQPGSGNDGRDVSRTDGCDRHGQRNKPAGNRLSGGDRSESEMTVEELKGCAWLAEHGQRTGSLGP